MAALIIKATEKCNSNCCYCDVVFKKQTGSSMSRETLEILFLRMDEYLKKNPSEKLELIWHGGEPLLMGADFYRWALTFQNTHCYETKSNIYHSIQTNMTCFSEEFVDVFKFLGIGSIGTSFDPEPHVRGPGKDIDSDQYNRMFMNGIRILERNGFGWGMIYVVTKKSLSNPMKVFNFLTNLKLSGGINMNPVLIYDDARKHIAVTPEEYVEFLGAIFPVWWKHRERYYNMEPFKSLTDNIMDGKMNLSCVDSGDCTYHHVNIAPNGDTSQCGRSADWNILPYGNIRDRTLFEILHDVQRDDLNQRSDILRKTECSGCRFWNLCHGGCPLDSYSQHNSFFHKSEWCHAKKGFIEIYFEPITGVKYTHKETSYAK